jgi:hypothetical protein
MQVRLPRSLKFPARVGESYRIEMQPPTGDRFYLTGEFREVDPPRPSQPTGLKTRPVGTLGKK